MRLQPLVNSYVTLSEANRYFTTRPYASDWGDTSVAGVTLVFSDVPAAGSTIVVNGTTITFVSGTPTTNQSAIISGNLRSTLNNLVAALPSTAEGEQTALGTVRISFWLAGTYGNGIPVSWNTPGITVKAGSANPSAAGNAVMSGGASNKTDLQKSAALIFAARHIEYGYTFKGILTDDKQVMSWPRQEVYDKNGRKIPSNIIPMAIKDAQCELSAQWIVSDQLMPAASFMTRNDADFGKGGVKRIKLGTMEKEYRDTGSYLFALANGEAPSTKVYPFVDMMLSEYSLKSPAGTSGRISI